MTAATARQARQGRGCVFFNFGGSRALQLLVSIHSLRKYYSGPVTVFLAPDEYSDRLARDVERLGASVGFLANLSKSFDRHRIFLESPYETTLSLDSDIIFTSTIDPLWEPLEREGVLVTRFFAPPYGFDGTPDSPGEMARVGWLRGARNVLDPAVLGRALDRMVNDRIDINIGVLGISRPKGDAFLEDLAAHMEKGRGRNIELLDEAIVLALVPGYPHHLADEKWNCPADEEFRHTNLSDAAIIHYFGDGHILFGDQRMGRNAMTWAGKKWYRAYFEAAAALDLSEWRKLDRTFDSRVERPFAHGAVFAYRLALRNVRLKLRRMRGLFGDNSYWGQFR